LGPARPFATLQQVGEGRQQVVGILGLDFVEAFDGLAAGLDEGREHTGFPGLADVVVGVADVDRAVWDDAELLDEADDAEGASLGR